MPHWVKREDWSPEEERAAEVDRVLQVVQEGIIERRIKEWREMRRPHHKHKEEPGNDRVTNDTNQATLQQGQDPRAPVRRRKPKDQRDRSGSQDENRHREEQDEVLHHVHAEERGVVALDHRLQRDQQEDGGTHD